MDFKMNKTLARLLLLLGVVFVEAGGLAATLSLGDGAQSPTGQPRMRSLSIARVDAISNQAMPGNAQATAVTGGSTAAQVQNGSGNTQTMIVNAGGGRVYQYQSGSGNWQSMNIGTVDGLSVQGGVSSRNQ
jgi:hypothetical protein